MGGYATEGERVVGRLVEARLRDTDRMWANQRVTDDRKNAEVDFFLALPEAGFVVLEVKGGQTSTTASSGGRPASTAGASSSTRSGRRAGFSAAGAGGAGVLLARLGGLVWHGLADRALI